MRAILLAFDRVRQAFQGCCISCYLKLFRTRKMKMDDSFLLVDDASNDDAILSAAFADDMAKALRSINAASPILASRVRNNVDVIMLSPILKTAGYIGTTRMCIINILAVRKRYPDDERFVSLAGLLVHTASVGTFNRKGIPYFGSAKIRIRKYCDSLEVRLIDKMLALISNDACPWE